MEEIQQLVTEATASGANIEMRHHAFGLIVKRFQDMAFASAYAVLGDKNSPRRRHRRRSLPPIETLPNSKPRTHSRVGFGASSLGKVID